ncbi:dioxygenase [Peribacillus psychrosaccharolyticus]|uniref:Dioxygenase n=1 Tax=Peribacillus psychrosaccharolyticus TaxID=1407 RepID=A0A974S075_PERPY|nr:class III extradiol ring-cleavage dioxygenase [Peribacillus psychrosaccharolyticus]MEC2056530.1 class III extradiol ring-cleavage dioxygenase [Peribacillus psychrosaccharolyticus]MED3745662.1 class III extradiol ring-cleavage dioxygenase [Peribacillus psychrosaccharolyticus]QQT00327.1 dioxygenase [Peribacillus psychrosaccharolyticus]
MIPSLFLAHGTPLLLTEENPYTLFLENYVQQLPRPSAILIFSAHWESGEQAVTACRQNGIIYDFAGGPDELYQMTYSAPGEIELSDRIMTLLSKIGIYSVLDDTRRLDHGAWVPLKIMYPNADIPVIALSIDPELPLSYQYEIGKTLAKLREEDVLIIGSGGTSHNLEQFQYNIGVAEGWTVRFEEWLEDKVLKWDIESLFNFKSLAPYASLAVPTMEHFIPFIIAMGLGHQEKQAKLLHRSYQYGNLSLTAWRF